MSKDLIPPTPTAEDYASAAPIDAEHQAGGDPFTQFADWLTEARAREPNDANAMALATVDADGLPDVRMVLLKDVDASGFVFYSNGDSAKGAQLAGQMKAALCFHWKSLRRQVRVRGTVSQVRAEEADAYFATRARDAQIGAWASLQSSPLEGRFVLEARIAEFAVKFGVGPVPRPPQWNGYRLAPLSVEFWRDRPFRLHDRLVYRRPDLGAAWTTTRLYP